MAAAMTLADLQAETLSQKHRRLMQERCQHDEVYSSHVLADGEHHGNRVCLDCGKTLEHY